MQNIDINKNKNISLTQFDVTKGFQYKLLALMYSTYHENGLTLKAFNRVKST